MALLETLLDDFNGTTLDTTKWTPSTPATTSLTVAGGSLNLTRAPASGTASVTVTSATTYTLANSYAFIRLAPDTANPNPNFYFELYGTSEDYRVTVGATQITFSALTSTSANMFTPVNLTYDPVAMAYLRIDHSLGKVSMRTSPDGMTWTLRASANYNPTQAVRLYLAHSVSNNAATSTASIATVNYLPAVAAPTGIVDPETFGAPQLPAQTAPAGITDPETLGVPQLQFTPSAVNPDNITDPETFGEPELSYPRGYGTGIYGEGIYVGIPASVEPDGINDLDTIGAPSQQTPRDNPTYGTGTYGYGIYYGTVEPADQCTPLFNDIAGTGQPALHILGIGPWSPLIQWRGAANYGVGKGNLPARPALPLPPATSKGFTLRLDEGCEARFDLSLARGSGLIIDEMDTDLWWRRRDPRTRQVEMIGRFNVSHVNTSTSDTGLNVSVQCDDYSTVLGARTILRYKDVANHETQWDKGTPITDILKWAIPGNTRLDLSELDTYDLGTITQPYTLPPGTTLAEVFEQLNAISPIKWEWWIETPNDINAAPKLRFQLGTRGQDKGVVLFDLGKGPSPITSWTRNTAADNYANSLLYNGADGSVVKVIDAQVLQYGQRDAVAGNSTIDGTHIQLMRARASTKLAKLASRQATYTINLASGFWRGRAHIDVGDTVTLLLRLGKETLKEKHRVTEINVDIDAQGAEQVTLTLGTPLPSPDPRSKRSPLQRIVRHLHAYEPPPGSADVIGPDEE